PFWGVPLPQVAATIESGAPPLERERPDLPPRLLRAVAAALDVDPDRRPSAARLAAELRAALDAPRRERRRQAAPRLRLRGRADAAPRAAAPPASRVAHAASAVVAAVVTAAGGALLPFWTPGLLTGLALATAALTWRLPRIGLVLALFAPLLPFGNEAKGAALAYGAVALALLALGWRDPRGGLLFAAGPLLAPLGGLALVPLAVQPARGWLRRGAQAALAVLAAALVAGLRGSRPRERAGGPASPPFASPSRSRCSRRLPRRRRPRSCSAPGSSAEPCSGDAAGRLVRGGGRLPH